MSAHLGDLLSALADGELNWAEEAEARSHLAGCAGCAAELVAVERVRAALRGLPQIDLPTLVVERARFATRRPPRFAAAVAAVAAAAAAVVFAVAPLQDHTVTPRVGQLVQTHATSPANQDPLTQLTPAAVPVSFGR